MAVYAHKQQNCQLNQDIDEMSGDQEGQLVHGQAVVMNCVLACSQDTEDGRIS